MAIKAGPGLQFPAAQNSRKKGGLAGGVFVKYELLGEGFARIPDHRQPKPPIPLQDALL
jgi:hypothetical protein